MKPNSECNYTFPIVFEPNRIPIVWCQINIKFNKYVKLYYAHFISKITLQSVYQPGKPGIPGKPMEFHDTYGKPGKPMEFVNCTWNFRIKTFLSIHMQNLSIQT